MWGQARRLSCARPARHSACASRSRASFTIGQSYSGRTRVSHLDLFRLDSLEGEDPTLLEDYLAPETIVFVEWPAAAERELEADRVVLRLRLSHRGAGAESEPPAARTFWSGSRTP